MGWIIGLLAMILVALLYTGFQLTLISNWAATIQRELSLLRLEFANAMGTSLGEESDSSESHIGIVRALLTRTEADTDKVLNIQRAAREHHSFRRDQERKAFEKTLAEFQQTYGKKRAWREAMDFHRRPYR